MTIFLMIYKLSKPTITAVKLICVLRYSTYPTGRYFSSSLKLATEVEFYGRIGGSHEGEEPPSGVVENCSLDGELGTSQFCNSGDSDDFLVAADDSPILREAGS
uniref:MAM domain-containing protein n=1 Tax=Steinernema glaseri TaxID=37863 RepID=A0A1I7Z1F0_9BILA